MYSVLYIATYNFTICYHDRPSMISHIPFSESFYDTNTNDSTSDTTLLGGELLPRPINSSITITILTTIHTTTLHTALHYM